MKPTGAAAASPLARPYFSRDLADGTSACSIYKDGVFRLGLLPRLEESQKVEVQLEHPQNYWEPKRALLLTQIPPCIERQNPAVDHENPMSITCSLTSTFSQTLAHHLNGIH